MRVKVGNTWYSSDDQPLMVELTDNDKVNIANMLAEAHTYCVYPDTYTVELITKWMKT